MKVTIKESVINWLTVFQTIGAIGLMVFIISIGKAIIDLSSKPIVFNMKNATYYQIITKSDTTTITITKVK